MHTHTLTLTRQVLLPKLEWSGVFGCVSAAGKKQKVAYIKREKKKWVDDARRERIIIIFPMFSHILSIGKHIAETKEIMQPLMRTNECAPNKIQAIQPL